MTAEVKYSEAHKTPEGYARAIDVTVTRGDEQETHNIWVREVGTCTAVWENTTDPFDWPTVVDALRWFMGLPILGLTQGWLDEQEAKKARVDQLAKARDARKRKAADKMKEKPSEQPV